MNSSTTKPVSSAITVSTSQAWDNDGTGPWSTFVVQVGTPAQVSRVIVSTAGYETWVVVNQGCPPDYGTLRTCAFARGNLFAAENSTSWVNIGLHELSLATNLGYEGNGLFGYDVVELGYPTSGGPKLSKQVTAGIAAPDFWLGQFGLNPAPSNFTTLNDPQPSFLWNLVNQGIIPSTTWGYTAGAEYRQNKVQGSLTLGGYDASRFDAKTIAFSFYNDVARSFIVEVKSITSSYAGLSTATTPLTLMSDPILLNIDSTVPFIYLPRKICDNFAAEFGLRWDNRNEIYTINETTHQSLRSSRPTFTFTLANTVGQTYEIKLPYEAFDRTASFPILPNLNSTAKLFPLRRADNDTQYTLGRTFLQEAYLIADYDRREFNVSQCVWPSSLAPQIKTIQPSWISNVTVTNSDKQSSKPSTGVVVGAALGGFVILALVILAIWFRIWRPRHRKTDTSTPYLASDSGRDWHETNVIPKAELDAPWSKGLSGEENEVAHLEEMEGRQVAPKERFELAADAPPKAELDAWDYHPPRLVQRES